MRRPGSRRSQRGALIVEAVLAAVVIAVGLAAVTQALGGQLRALRTVKDAVALSALAQATLLEMEASVQDGETPPRPAEGTFAAPHDAFSWRLAAEPLEADAGVELSRVTLSVRQAPPSGGAVTLTALWPADLVPDEWY